MFTPSVHREQETTLHTDFISTDKFEGAGDRRRGDGSRGGTEGVSSCRSDSTPDWVCDQFGALFWLLTLAAQPGDESLTPAAAMFIQTSDPSLMFMFGVIIGIYMQHHHGGIHRGCDIDFLILYINIFIYMYVCEGVCGGGGVTAEWESNMALWGEYNRT